MNRCLFGSPETVLPYGHNKNSSEPRMYSQHGIRSKLHELALRLKLYLFPEHFSDVKGVFLFQNRLNQTFILESEPT